MKWTETIDIDAPTEEVFDAMLDQDRVMAWSAWPEATGFTCSVEGDSTSPGSEIVFRDKKGTIQGRQRIIAVEGRRVRNQLQNRGPFGRTMTPTVTFEATPLDERCTRAALEFEADVPLPAGVRHLVQAGMSRWVRRLHVRDLEMLKSHVESRHTTDQ
ncbi:MAG: SRPBCC family protein [Actinomycetota bacterium]